MHTCTQGIVSAADRSTQSAGLPGVVLHGLVQSDAAINPGSSGGPWFNALGQVIGVTAAIKTGTQSIGFAVPVSAVRQTVPEMLDVERRCGLTTGLELQFTPPCVVSAVAAGSPAAALGIQPRDVLELLDGKPIQDRYDFDLALLDRRPGEKLRLDWRRQNQSQGGDLVLAARAKPDGAALLKYYYGLTAVPLDPEKAIATGMRVHRGVVVAAVNPGPPYDRLPTPPLPGDVLARINNIRPRDLDHVGFLLDRIKPGEPVHFVFLRVKDHVPTRVDMVLTLTKKP
jgi:serine protease Do